MHSHTASEMQGQAGRSCKLKQYLPIASRRERGGAGKGREMLTTPGTERRSPPAGSRLPPRLQNLFPLPGRPVAAAGQNLPQGAASRPHPPSCRGPRNRSAQMPSTHLERNISGSSLRRFGATYCKKQTERCCLQSLALSWSTKMEAARISETSINFHQSRRCHKQARSDSI
jgi:hypothetical protein